jgi:hypothetical protein
VIHVQLYVNIKLVVSIEADQAQIKRKLYSNVITTTPFKARLGDDLARFVYCGLIGTLDVKYKSGY